MSHPVQVRISVTYIRGGASKGIFFRLQDLPPVAQQSGVAYDVLPMRMIGSPNPYGKQTDDIDGTTSNVSKTAILNKSTRPDHDANYLFDQVPADKPFVNWSGNCGDLSTAVEPFAISNGLIDTSRILQNGVAVTRIWQANIGKIIIAHVPIINGVVQGTDDLELDGVTFPTAKVQPEFPDPAVEKDSDGGGAMPPAGNSVDDLEVPDVGVLKTAMINAGIPAIFINVEAIGYTGTELQDATNGDVKALAMFETTRARGAVCIGLIKSIEEAATRQHAPKAVFIVPPKGYVASNGKKVDASDMDLLVHTLLMGKLRRAMMGTTAIAIGTTAAIPGTLVNLAAGGGERGAMCFGHPSGTLRVSTEAKLVNGKWAITKAIVSHSVRVLMESWVRVSG